MNSAPFFIGQKVIRTGCSVPDMNLKRGNTYMVAALKCCPCCKNWKVSCVEFPLNPNPGIKETCSCGEIIVSDCLNYGRAEFFADIEENDYKNITKELAKLPIDEVPDVKEIKELVN